MSGFMTTADAQPGGCRGKAVDCVTRSTAIALRLPYRHVYALLNEQARCKPPTRTPTLFGAERRVPADLSKGIGVAGLALSSDHKISATCRVHLKAAELRRSPLIVRCSKHTTAVIDGIIHDTYDLRGTARAACTATSPTCK